MEFEFNRRLLTLEEKYAALTAVVVSHGDALASTTTTLLEGITVVATAARGVDNQLASAIEQLSSNAVAQAEAVQMLQARVNRNEEATNVSDESIGNAIVRLREQIMGLGVAGAMLASHVIGDDDTSVEEDTASFVDEVADDLDAGKGESLLDILNGALHPHPMSNFEGNS